MNVNKKTARIAGIIYLLLGITGGFNMLYIPSSLVVEGDAAATAANIIASEHLFRIGVVSGLICQICFILLPLVLYKLLKPISKTYASLMVIFALVSVPISMLNLVSQFAMLELLSGAEYLKAFETGQLFAFAMFFFNLYGSGVVIAQIFWGIWLFPLGVLVFKSGFLPRALGIWLVIGCFGYVSGFVTDFLFPHYETIIEPFIVFAALSELAFITWLLIRGLNETRIGVSGLETT